MRSSWISSAAPLMLLALAAIDADSQVIRPSLSVVDDFAGTVSNADTSSIQNLTNLIINASLFSNCPTSVRSRVFQAEVSFRNGSRDANVDGSIVSAVNTFGSSAQLPNFYLTSIEQVRLLRLKLLALFPNY